MAGERTLRHQRSSTRQRLERWRRQHGGPGRPIPEELWHEAVELARVEGVGATAKALRLDRRRLTARMSEMGGQETGGIEAGFVEVETGGMWLSGQTIVRLEGPDGERLQVEVNGPTPVDLVGLAQAFWSRQR